MKSTKRTEHDEIRDRVYAAMETGNTGQARTLLREYKELHKQSAERLHADVLADYGVVL